MVCDILYRFLFIENFDKKNCAILNKNKCFGKNISISMFIFFNKIQSIAANI